MNPKYLQCWQSFRTIPKPQQAYGVLYSLMVSLLLVKFIPNHLVFVYLEPVLFVVLTWFHAKYGLIWTANQTPEGYKVKPADLKLPYIAAVVTGLITAAITWNAARDPFTSNEKTFAMTIGFSVIGGLIFSAIGYYKGRARVVSVNAGDTSVESLPTVTHVAKPVSKAQLITTSALVVIMGFYALGSYATAYRMDNGDDDSTAQTSAAPDDQANAMAMDNSQQVQPQQHVRTGQEILAEEARRENLIPMGKAFTDAWIGKSFQEYAQSLGIVHVVDLMPDGTQQLDYTVQGCSLKVVGRQQAIVAMVLQPKPSCPVPAATLASAVKRTGLDGDQLTIGTMVQPAPATLEQSFGAGIVGIQSARFAAVVGEAIKVEPNGDGTEDRTYQVPGDGVDCSIMTKTRGGVIIAETMWLKPNCVPNNAGLPVALQRAEFHFSRLEVSGLVDYLRANPGVVTLNCGSPYECGNSTDPYITVEIEGSQADGFTKAVFQIQLDQDDSARALTDAMRLEGKKLNKDPMDLTAEVYNKDTDFLNNLMNQLLDTKVTSLELSRENN